MTTDDPHDLALDRTHAERLREIAAAEEWAGRSRVTYADKRGEKYTRTCYAPHDALDVVAHGAAADRLGLTGVARERYVRAARIG